MTKFQIKVLIVDDSRFIRFNLERMLKDVEGIEVVGIARNGIEALEFLEKNSVDVVVLDFFMPKMNGLETLAEIMKRYRTPTIMITIANREEHADLYFSALKLGAFEVIPKPTGREALYVDVLADTLKNNIKMAYEARSKIREAVRNEAILEEYLNIGRKVIEDVEKKAELQEQTQSQMAKTDTETTATRPFPTASYPSIRTKEQVPDSYEPPCNLLIIGASMGGPPTINDLLSYFNRKMSTITVIVQHMPSVFTNHFAQRLDTINNHKCSEAKQDERLIPGNCYVAPGDFHMRFGYSNNDVYCVLDQEPRISGLRPAVDYTLASGACIFKKKMVAVILTGMGNDGAQGVIEVKKNGGKVIAQLPTEALISSMPEKAIQTKCVDQIAPVKEIANILNQIL